MAQIKDANPKTPSAYLRVTDNPFLAEILQKSHSTMIRNGNELEDLIAENSNLNVSKNISISSFDPSDYEDQTLIHKFKIENQTSIKNTHVDFLLINPKNKSMILIEMKDGDNFDTKKATGEIDKLENCQRHFNKTYSEWETKASIVLWNNEDITQASFKDFRAKNYIINGRTIQNTLGVKWDNIELKRKQDRFFNTKWLIRNILFHLNQNYDLEEYMKSYTIVRN